MSDPAFKRVLLKLSGEALMGPLDFGTDPETLGRIAAASGGRSYRAEDAAKLDAVYERLGSQVARKKEKREISSAFAGGALVLVLLGGGMSLMWFGRLP